MIVSETDIENGEVIHCRHLSGPCLEYVFIKPDMIVRMLGSEVIVTSPSVYGWRWDIVGAHHAQAKCVIGESE